MKFCKIPVSTVGNWLKAGISALNVFEDAAQYFFWAVLIFLAAIVFFVLAKRYVVVDFFHADRTAPAKS
jgi:POT family proton-dependent oligopeptide transporter